MSKHAQGTILIASIYDRLIHLIAHAQIGSQRYHRRKFLIRDALEFNYLLSRPGADYQAASEAFQAAGAYAIQTESPKFQVVTQCAGTSD